MRSTLSILWNKITKSNQINQINSQTKQAVLEKGLWQDCYFSDGGLILDWRRVSDYFEIRFILKYAFLIDREVIRFSEIEVKNISGKKLSKIKLTVATNDWLDRERRNFIELGSLENSQVLAFALTNIPLLALRPIENQLCLSHGNLNVVLHSLEEDRTNTTLAGTILEVIIPSSFPFQTYQLNSI